MRAPTDRPGACRSGVTAAAPSIGKVLPSMHLAPPRRGPRVVAPAPGSGARTGGAARSPRLGRSRRRTARPSRSRATGSAATSGSAGDAADGCYDGAGARLLRVPQDSDDALIALLSWPSDGES